jgi:hypothetical protein
VTIKNFRDENRVEEKEKTDNKRNDEIKKRSRGRMSVRAEHSE